jgi:serine protease Do
VALGLLVLGFAAGVALAERTAAPTDIEVVAPPAAAPAGVVAPAVSEQPIAVSPGGAATAGVPDFSSVAAQAVSGVVNISSVQVVRQPNSPFADDPFFRYFFGDDVFGMRERRSASLGSGVIISSDGHIITNSHVVGPNVATREVTITLSDKREVPGSVIGTDPATDIALLKVNAARLPAIPWGDSSRLRVGEWVLAIGSPFQLSQTVTAGIVSATGRANVGFAEYEDFIQTDAAINPGNSGGALIDTRGELVGINTGIFSQSGGYQGIGFAVPSLLARRIAEDLTKYGEVRRGTILGIDPYTMTPQIAAQTGLSRTAGVLVARIAARSAAYQAGMRAGDVIVGFNGQEIVDLPQLFRLVSDATVGSTATLRVLRAERTIDLMVPISAAGPTRQ